MKQQTSEKKPSQLVSLPLVAIVMAAIVGYMVIYVTPIAAELPVEITEELKVLAVTEKGVVFETSTGVALVTDQYDGQQGDVIEVTYSVPGKYLDDKRKLQTSFEFFHPDS